MNYATLFGTSLFLSIWAASGVWIKHIMIGVKIVPSAGSQEENRKSSGCFSWLFLLVPFGCRALGRSAWQQKAWLFQTGSAGWWLEPRDRLWMERTPLRQVFSLLGEVNVIFLGNQQIRP